MPSYTPNVEGSAWDAVDEKPNDLAVQNFRGFMMATAGTVAIQLLNGNNITVSVVPYVPCWISGRRVFATGTTALGLILFEPGRRFEQVIPPPPGSDGLRDDDFTNQLEDDSGNILVAF